MSKALDIVFLCLVSTGIWQAPLAHAETPAAGAGATSGAVTYGSLKFEETAFDFGDVYRGNALNHRFKFINNGPGTLKIQGVHAACGCTAAEVEKGRTYQPGETGFVDVHLDTTDFAGSLVKSVTVMSNERLLPDRTLTLKAFVKTEFEADPPLVDFGDIRSQGGGEKVVRIKPVPNQKDRKLNIISINYNKDLFDVITTPPASPGEDWLLTVKLRPGLPPGYVKETLQVQTSSAHLREMPLPIRANVMGNIDFTPSYLEFGAIGASETARRSITMRGVTSFDVVKTRAELIINGRRIDDAGKYIKVGSLPHEKDKRLVSIELKNEAKVAGSVHGKLYFETTDTAQKELAVDFYAFFR